MYIPWHWSYISGSSSKLGRAVAFHHCTLLLDVDQHSLKLLLQPSYVSYNLLYSALVPLSVYSVQWNLYQVDTSLSLKISSHIYCKISLHSADTDLLSRYGQQYYPISLHKTCNKQTVPGLFTSESLVQTLLINIMFAQHCCFSRLFKIDALTEWKLCYEQSLILHFVAVFYKRVIN